MKKNKNRTLKISGQTVRNLSEKRIPDAVMGKAVFGAGGHTPMTEYLATVLATDCKC